MIKRQHEKAGEMGAQILLVDDNEDFLDSTRDVLEEEGYRVSTARDGEQALSLMDQDLFDVVLMDIKMPKMNGVETFIKMKEKKPDIKVVLFTAFVLSKLIRLAHQEGALAIYDKPINMGELLALLKNSTDMGTNHVTAE